MNFKRYNESDNSWTDSHYIKKTDTDTITTLPATVYPLAQTATLGMKGQTVQNGTPTSDNPILPQGTGERTGNLLNVGSWYGDYKQPDGTYQATRAQLYTIKIKPFTSDDIGKTFTFAMDISPVSGNVRVTANNGGTVTNGNSAARSVVTFTVATVDDTIYFNYGSFGDTTTTISNIMLNLGSTALPYKPNGYKIPISSADTTTPVYLGEVETTRKIGKLVLTGEETIVPYDPTYSRFAIIIQDSLIVGVRLSPAICSHYQVISDGQSIASVPNNAIYSDSGNGRWFIKTTDITTVADFKSYLAAQYSNGTPVTIWYVLATEETGIVNEPLMKIGDYADEVANISIPVTAGGDTLSVDTTVQPSEVTVNYKGWHPVADVHERDNGAWT